MAEVREQEAPQSIASWISVTILTCFIIIVGHIFRNIPRGFVWGVNGWPLHLIYIIILSHLLGKISPKLRLNATQLLCILIAATFVSGGVYAWALPGEKNWTDFMPNYSTNWFIGIPASEELREIYFPLGFPEWFIPRDVSTAEALMMGPQPGQVINWGSLIGPIITSTLLIGSTLLLFAFITWVFVGPQWVEKERVAYPATWSYSYLIHSATTVSDGKTKLFNLKDPEIKVYWICVFLGMFISIPFFISLLMPELAAPWGVWGAGQYGMPLHEWIGVPPLLPGAQWGGYFWIGQFIVWLAVPYEWLINMILGWLVIMVLYSHVVTVVLGIVPYTPGIEGDITSNVGLHPANPFPFPIFFGWGVPIGAFFWFLWSGRERLRTIWNSITREDIKEHGMSLRLRLVGLVICFLVWLALWVAIGVPIFPALIFILTYIIWGFLHARVTGEVYGCDVWECWVWTGELAFWAGPASGAWGWTFPQINRSTVAYAVMTEMHVDCWGWNNGSGGIGNLSSIYRCAYDTKANLSDILKYLIIFVAVSVPVYLVWDLWVMSHLGMVNMGIYADNFGVPPYTPDQALDFGARSLAWSLGSPEKTYAWAIAGAIFTFICMYLRSIFPWFIFNPIAWAMVIQSATYFWLMALLALPLKYLIFKLLGPTRTVKYLKPIISGSVTGAVCLQIFLSLYVLSTSGMANLAANWR